MENEQLLALSQEFASLGAQLRGESDTDDVLQRALKVVVEHVPGCRHASISDAKATTIAASDDVAAASDAAQREHQQGPCLQAALDGEDYYSFDLESEVRWPDYRAAVLSGTPIRSSLAFPLRDERAALNLFGDEPGAFEPDGIVDAAIIAALVSLFLTLRSTENRAAHLETALENSRLIGAAVGIVMHARRVTREDAFELLRTSSQNLNRKLRDVADQVVETGAVPEVDRKD